MRSILYILLMSFKNDLLDLRRKPAKLILFLLALGLIGISVYSGINQQARMQEDLATLSSSWLPVYYFTAIFFCFMMLFMVAALQKGLSSGGTFFDMNDVNLLFVSPVSPKKILIYGLVRMARMTFMSSIFILFQSATLGSTFGINFADLCMILLIYMLALILAEFTALLIYSITNGQPRRKLYVKIGAVLCLCPAAVYFIYQYLLFSSLSAALDQLTASPLFSAIPIVGWASQAASSWIMDDWLGTALYLGLTALFGVVLTVIIMLSKSDYYEDVLCATESAFDKKRALSDGNIHAQSMNSRKIKVSGTGLSGYGVSALFGRQLRESFRENRFILLPTSSILLILSVSVACFFLKDNQNILLRILMILMSVQVFLIGTGRGLKDTYIHYIYMIPESSFSKIVWSNLQHVFQILLESILLFGLAGIISKSGFLLIAACAVTYTLFNLFLLGINYASMRWLSADLSTGLLITFYMLAVAILVLPGLIPALIIAFHIGAMPGILTGLLIFSAWELAVALVAFALAKGVLDRCDMPVMPGKK